MLEYGRIDRSEGIDLNKSNNLSKECSLCSFWFFNDKNFNYQRFLCSGCHDMSMNAVSMKNLAVVYSNGNAYRINFAFMTLNEATHLLNNSVITNKKGVL